MGKGLIHQELHHPLSLQLSHCDIGWPDQHSNIRLPDKKVFCLHEKKEDPHIHSFLRKVFFDLCIHPINTSYYHVQSVQSDGYFSVSQVNSPKIKLEKKLSLVSRCLVYLDCSHECLSLCTFFCFCQTHSSFHNRCSSTN